MEKTRQRNFAANMSWIFIGNVLHAVFSFLINLIVARTLTTNDNGIVNYAASWIAFYNAIAAMGINSVINKYTTEELDESNNYLSSAIIFRLITGVIAWVLVVITVIGINKGERIVLYISAIQALSILFSAGDTLVFWFRYQRRADVVAITRLIAFFVSALIKIIGIVVLKNIYVYVIGVVLETILFSAFLVIGYRKWYSKKIKFSVKRVKEVLKVSYPFVFSAVLATIYAQTDRVMLKNMLGNESVAYYSVAVTLAGLMSIVTSAVIEGFRPEVIAAKNKGNEDQYKLRLAQVYCITFWICIAFGCFVTLFSKHIILIAYGEKYLPSQAALSLIVWYTSFAYFGTINNIFMVAEGQEKWVQITTLAGAVVNVILNLLMIPTLGIRGAALASLCTQIVANFLMPAIIPGLRPIIGSILRGVAFRDVGIKEIVSILTTRIRRK